MTLSQYLCYSCLPVTYTPLLPPPSSFGLPYDSWRNRQDQAVLQLVDAPTRFVIGNMPTGFGKSLVYTAAARLLGGRGAVLTSTKGLQSQLLRDFGPMGMVEMKGQSNYDCRVLTEPNGMDHLEYPLVLKDGGTRDRDVRQSCEEGPCKAGIKCKLQSVGCHYYDALATARSSELVTVNYAMWMTAHRHMGPKDPEKRNHPGQNNGLGHFDFLILDEAHDAPDQLASFLTVEITAWEVEGLLGTKFLPDGADTQDWVQWARFHAPRATDNCNNLEMEAKSGSRQAMRKLAEWRRLEGKLSQIGAGMMKGWLAVASTYGRNRSIQFAPILPGPYAESTLFCGIPRIVMVSATCNPKTATLLGIGKSDLTYDEFPSTFPVERRPIIHVPTVRLNNRSTDIDLRTWLNRIDQIIDKRLDRKGIIHTVSYNRRTLVYQNSRHQQHMVVHDTADARAKVERFKSMSAPAVLVSPSVSTGYDFPYSECVHPFSRVLTADLKWVCAGDVKPGDQLAGFAESHPFVWQPTTVLANHALVRPSYRLTLADGTSVVCATDHYWLSRRAGKGRWVRTEDIGVTDVSRTKIVKACDVWGPPDPRAAGYLAAAFDGEGSYHIGSRRLGFYQKHNDMLSAVEAYLGQLGFVYSKRKHITQIKSAKPSEICRLEILGGFGEVIRFMGQMRPHRLYPKFEWGKELRGEAVPVVSKEFMGEQPVQAIKTTSKTLIVEGLASHNCEYVIIGKLPFPDTRDPVLKARTEVDEEYSAYITVQDLVQQAGRGMRAADDQCEVFIIDDSIRWFSRMYKHMIPRWFSGAMKSTTAIPAPPARLNYTTRIEVGR